MSLLFSEWGPDHISVMWKEHGLWVRNLDFSLASAACYLGKAPHILHLFLKLWNEMVRDDWCPSECDLHNLCRLSSYLKEFWSGKVWGTLEAMSSSLEVYMRVHICILQPLKVPSKMPV